jgi:hypothetical protein
MEVPLWPAVTGEWARAYNPGERQMMMNLVRVWLPRQIPSRSFVNAVEMAVLRRLRPFPWLPNRNVTKCVSPVAVVEPAAWGIGGCS